MPFHIRIYPNLTAVSGAIPARWSHGAVEPALTPLHPTPNFRPVEPRGSELSVSVIGAPGETNNERHTTSSGTRSVTEWLRLVDGEKNPLVS